MFYMTLITTGYCNFNKWMVIFPNSILRANINRVELI